MRRTSKLLATLAVLSGAVLPPASTAVQAQGAAQPPHAYLFGTWTGGIFPAPSNLTPQACLSQPVVIFTRDLVLRATLTDQMLAEREIETARANSQGVEFRFAVTAGGGGGLLGGDASPQVGFGCEDPNVLHVQRRGENEIAFPGCADFPNPLVRCHTR
jgi:hypothetical protein